MTKMEKILAMVLMFVTILLVSFNFLYVKAVDLNLTENTSSSTNSSDDEDDDNSTSSASNSSRSSSSTNSSSLSSSATVKTTNSTESGLGITNILNIIKRSGFKISASFLFLY